MINETNIFEQVSREKTRFPYMGTCSTEDLWDLSVRELDGIYKTLNTLLREENEGSLLDLKDDTTSELDIQVSIIRHIVDVKLTESADAVQETARRQKKTRILSILADKQDESFAAMSEEDLAKMLADL